MERAECAALSAFRGQPQQEINGCGIAHINGALIGDLSVGYGLSFDRCYLDIAFYGLFGGCILVHRFFEGVERLYLWRFGRGDS